MISEVPKHKGKVHIVTISLQHTLNALNRPDNTVSIVVLASIYSEKLFIKFHDVSISLLNYLILYGLQRDAATRLGQTLYPQRTYFYLFCQCLPINRKYYISI